MSSPYMQRLYFDETDTDMVKSNKTTKTAKSTKTQKKHANKIVVQIRRVPSTEKITKVKKISEKLAKNMNEENTGVEKPKRKYRKKKKQENGDKFKFSIVDYLRTSIGDKLGIDEIKKWKKEERKARKENGKLLKSQKSKDAGNDFGNYELLGNDPDDFMIPLDVVITTDPSPAEEGLTITKNEEDPTHMETSSSDNNNVSDVESKDDVSKSKDEVLQSKDEVADSNNVVLESNNESLDADSLRTAYKEILDSNNIVLKKETKGTHFILAERGSKNCEQCSASFNCAYKLKRHMLSHSDERKFFCDTCGNGFKTNYHLSRHKTNVHSIIGMFSCDLCDQEFTSKISLKDHKLEAHPTVVSYLCSVCQKTYASKKGLKRHEKQVHIKK